MNTDKLIHIFKGLKFLNNINLEEKLISDSKNKTLFDNDYFIDLSQILFAELGAITHLVLIIENYLKNKKSNVYVALPTFTLTEKEKNSKSYSDETKLDLLKKRKKVNNFLKTVGFVSVIREISKTHDNEALLTEEYQFEAEFKREVFENAFSVIFETKSIENFDYKFILPLEWLDCNKGINDFTKIEERIDKILGNKDRGLDIIDVQGIKNVVLSELIKNVNEHAGVKYALFTIGLINSNSFNKDYINPVEVEYINWIKEESIKSLVEIYFGDTGNGILTNEFETQYFKERIIIDKEEQLKWAFEKWSTRKNGELRRGTKGIYRIQRIVNKYNGIFHIRTGLYDGGFSKGGLIEEEWKCKKTKYSFEGTFIQIKLCPYSEAKEFRFTLKRNIKKKWKTVQYNPKLNGEFIDVFKNEIRNCSNLLIVLNFKEISDLDAKALLENNLSEISFYSHPCAVVVYILSNLRNDTLQTLVESTNEFIIRKTRDYIIQEIVHKDAEEIYDPVLVIGDDNKAFWYGGNQYLIGLLNESLEKPTTDLKLSNLDIYKYLDNDIQSRIRLHLENDNKLVNVDKDERLAFNFTNIDTFFRNEILKKINETKSDKTLKYCSPKLEIVDSWLNIKDLIENNEYGYALTLYLKFKKFIETQSNLKHSTAFDSTEVKNNLFLLIDHNQQRKLAVAFAGLYGIKNKNIKCVSDDINPNIPRRTKLFPVNSGVIILTTIISSSETVRRLVKYVKRDLANPIVIICLCNNRRYNITKLETWDKETSILSINQKYNSEEAKYERNSDYFKEKYNTLYKSSCFVGPDYSFEKKLEHKEPSYELESGLRQHIIDKKAFHYNHIGIYRDRHFTFYLDKEKVLKGKSVLWEKIDESIKTWKKENKINDFVIYLPKTIFNTKGTPFLNFLYSLSKNVCIVTNEIDVINNNNVVYFDFGIISGKSINNIIVKCKQVSNLLFCILFDQSNNNNNLDFYQRINSLNNEFIKVLSKPTNFKFEYIYKLSLGYFTSETCPICEHIAALDKYKLNIEYMYHFSEDRQARLKLIESDEVIHAEFPYDFYYNFEYQDHEISSEIVMIMFEFKTLLEKAETNTQYRIEVFKSIYEIYSDIDLYLLNCNSKLYAVIYFLSFEVNWLQKEPLIFRDFRVMLSEIAFRISTTSLTELSEKFSKSNTSYTTPTKLATRYKYSAVSLLRSTNKLKFCESISQILISAYDGESLSNNLAQNTFYHLVSLLQNEYNNSKKYFEAIEKQLDEFSNNTFKLSIAQKVTLEKIDNLNKQALKKLEIQSVNSDMELIKLLKKEKENHYDSKHHPQPEYALGNLKLNNFSNVGLNDIVVNKNDSPFYPLFEQKVSNTLTDWRCVSYFIESTILPYTMKFSDELIRSYTFNSTYFLNEILNIIKNNEKNSLIEEFSLMINKISIDPLYYFSVNQRYNHLHNIIFSKIIKEESQFFDFLSQFPSDLIDIINIKFKVSFPLLKIVNSCTSTKVFYPKIKLLEDFHLIIQNIHRRLNDNKKTEKYVNKIYDKVQFYIDIIPDETYIIMNVVYDSTDEKNEDKPREGGLTDIKAELNKFGGDMIFNTHTNENGFFCLKFKYLKYE